MQNQFDLGKKIYPEGAQISSKGLLYFYLFMIAFNSILIIQNSIEGDWFWVLIETIFTILFLFFILIIPFGKLTIYEKGFEIKPIYYERFFKDMPKYLRIDQIIVITPDYKLDTGIFKIINYRFYFKKDKYFILPQKKVKEYIEVFRENFPNQWQNLYNERYEIENINWEKIEKYLKLTDIKLIGYSFIFGFILFGVILGVYAIAIGIKDLFEDSLQIGIVFICSLQVGIAVGRVYDERKSKSMKTLKMYVKMKDKNSVPQNISILPEFKKWVEKYEKVDIKHIETFDDWQIPGKSSSLIDPEKKEKNMKNFNMRFTAIFIVMFIVVIVIFSTSLPLLLFQEEKYNFKKDKIPLTGSYNITNQITFQNETLIIDDSFIVRSGVNVTLNNVTIIWESNSGVIPGLYVEQNGSIEAKNCIFKGNNSKIMYKYEIHGQGKFINCTFFQLWGDRNELVGQGGIEIYHDDVILEDCNIYEAQVSGIVIGDCSPTIQNCLITGCYDDGIEIFGGKAQIINNEIRNNGDGIMTYNKCKARIENNSIIDNSGRGIGIIEDSDPIINNNHFSNNDEDDIYQSSGLKKYLGLFLLIMIATIILAPIIVYIKGRKKLLKK
jgi:hypothetical protein